MSAIVQTTLGEVFYPLSWNTEQNLFLLCGL